MTQNMPQNYAYDKGVKAALKGKSISKNPYSQNLLKKAWEDGWNSVAPENRGGK